jgi:hypothetical protein
VVSTLINEKPKLVKKKGLVPGILLTFMDMCTKCPIGAGVLKFHEADEQEGLGFDDDQDEDVQSVHLMAQLMIDTLAMAVNKKFLFQLAHQKCMEFMQVSFFCLFLSFCRFAILPYIVSPSLIS